MNKLREKLEVLHNNAQTKEIFLNNCEQLTEDFAIRFTDWILLRHFNNKEPKELTELLEMFKENYYE